MPDKREYDEEKKKEIEHLLEEIKKDAPDVTKGEIDELESLLDSILSEPKMSLPKRLLKGTISYSTHFLIMYGITLMAFMLFLSFVALQNRWMVFVVALVICGILTTFEEIPRNPFRKHFISINSMLFLSIVIGIVIVNREFYTVFQFSAAWVFYILFVEFVYNFIFIYMSKRKVGSKNA